jgi:uncharacterized protein YlxW (UPF0749 family)
VMERGAEELQRDGIVEILQTVYRRPLHDYAYEFAHIAARKDQLLASIRHVEFETAVVKAQEENATKNTEARRQEKAKLAEDQSKVQQESQRIAKYADDLEASYKSARSELSRLYRENAALHARIVAANEQLTREIEAGEATPTALGR